MSWKEHLLGMDYLRDSVGLRAYGQKNPLRDYKKEGFERQNIKLSLYYKSQLIQTFQKDFCFHYKTEKNE